MKPHYFLLFGILLFRFCQIRNITKITGKCIKLAQAHIDNIWARWLKVYLPAHNVIKNGTRNVHNWKKMIWCGLPTQQNFIKLGCVKKCRSRNNGNIRSCDILNQSGVVFRPVVKFSPCIGRHCVCSSS